MTHQIQSRPRLRILIVGVMVAIAIFPAIGRCADPDLTSMSLEALMNLEVTSVSKKQQSLKSSAAAVFVISQEDIRRSTARSVPELLRIVPGLQVARVDGSRWAVSARGNNGLFANKLLVLMDGRSVYTPLFSGVYWEGVDTNLEDIERIEIIRGPGAALWGANAVNGVINIITKKASVTTGGLVTAGGGTEERGFGAVRYGAKIGESSAVRVFGKYSNVDDAELPSGESGHDGHSLGVGGFRLDGTADTLDYTLQGDIMTGNDRIEAAVSELAPPYQKIARRDSNFTGGDILGRAVKRFEDGSELALQFYFNQENRADLFLKQNISTYDLDAQYRFRLAEKHEFTVGSSVRTVDDGLISRSVVSFTPDTRVVTTAGAFAQDDIELSDQVHLIIGTKFEHNEYTGAEWQPNIRAIWEPAAHQSVWASISRAVRTPSRADNDIELLGAVVPGELPTAIELVGNHSLQSERLVAYEIGYRVEPLESLAFDLATFYNDYSTVYSNELGEPYFDARETPQIVAPLVPDTLGQINSFGGELLVTWQACERLRLQAWYAYLHSSATADEGSTAIDFGAADKVDAQNLAALRAGLTLTSSVELDGLLRYVDAIESYSVPSYLELDVRLGWRYSNNIELSLVGNNLLDSRHVEYQADQINLTRAEIQRGVYAMVRWNF